MTDPFMGIRMGDLVRNKISGWYARVEALEDVIEGRDPSVIVTTRGGARGPYFVTFLKVVTEPPLEDLEALEIWLHEP